MTYRFALNSAWTKFQRGRLHVRAFRAAIESEFGTHPIYYQLRREYDAELCAITWKIERLIEIDGAWSLIVADAMRNSSYEFDTPRSDIGCTQERRASTANSAA